ncbi:MAG: hypothetical protein IPJ68_05525 [Candidatus Moraniibacteriota bacterium]|nr:MAG: hypothetical protein IPJ68_05525 [Candidatus Moranbacteria bacterium]
MYIFWYHFNMDNLEQRLRALGLEEKEAIIYLVCLRLGKDTAFHIAERSGLKRTTAYFILNNLAERRLVATEKTRKATLFSPAHPRRLQIQVEHQKKVLDDLLPELAALYNMDPDKPTVQVFEGENGLKRVYEDIIADLEKKAEVLFYGSVAHLEIYPDLIQAWQRATKNKVYRIRELLNVDQFHQEYAREISKNKNPHHILRSLPEDSAAFQNDNAIYGNKVVIFSTKNKLFATVIESHDIAQSYRAMYELAWLQGKDYM